ncbi:molybdenum cofactor guanylyltransferase [Castellaniella sp.]|uniref:molybdenum cofactor guanylyltransferase n=1 Tax=Castellaniella sp. TaxID=1955812 RepID=UPI003C70C5FC
MPASASVDASMPDGCAAAMPDDPAGGRFDGLILAGGLSRRMRTPDTPDIDKGLRDWQGQPLVAHVCRFMRGQGVDRIHISANRNTQAYAAHGRVVPDAPDQQDCGPLAGVLAGLRQAQSPWLFVLPVDVVRWPADLLARLAAAARPDHPAYARTLDGPHPLCVLVHRRQQASLQAFVQSGGRQVQAWLRGRQARPVDFAGQDCLVNLNTPQDWGRWAGLTPEPSDAPQGVNAASPTARTN